MKYKNIVFSGGGVLGYYYLGFLEYLEKNNYPLEQFKNIVGTSIGSFFAVGMALNYTSSEFKKHVINVLDYDRLKSFDLFNMMENFAVDNAKKFEHYIKSMIREKVGRKDITFNQLYNLYGKNLIIVSTCLETQEIVYFSKDNYPTMKIWKAVRMSMGVPFLFKPFVYNNKHYVDGALKMNFAIKLFNEQNTLGLYLQQSNKKINIKTIGDYIHSLLDMLISNKKKIQLQDVISIHNMDPPLTTFHIHLDETTIQSAIDHGYKIVEQFFKDRNEKVQMVCESLVKECVENGIENCIV